MNPDLIPDALPGMGISRYTEGGENTHLLVRLPLTLSEKGDFSAPLYTEAMHEFTLPDYLPEIKKLLSVSLTVLPGESYVGAGTLDFSGECVYGIYYVTGEGALAHAEFTGGYESSLPFSLPPSCSYSNGIEAYSDSRPELVQTRVLSPRKISTKARIRSTVTAYGYHALEEKYIGNPRGEIEKKYDSAVYGKLFRGKQESLMLSDEIIEKDSDRVRILPLGGAVSVTRVNAETDCVVVGGEVILSFLQLKEETHGEEPEKAVRKIPFECEVPLDGAKRQLPARAYGEVKKVSYTVGEGRILCDCEVALTAEARETAVFSFVSDCFSTGEECECELGESVLPLYGRMQNAFFTFSEAISYEKLGMKKEDRIIDVNSEFTVSGLEEKNARGVFVGNGEFHFLIQTAEKEFQTADCTLPFRYLPDGDLFESGELPKEAGYDARFTPVGLRVRCDGEKCAIDCEVSVSYRMETKTKVERLFSASFGEKIPKKKSGLMLVYPAPGETLWEIAKKYHVSPTHLGTENRIEGEDLSKTRMLVI